MPFESLLNPAITVAESNAAYATDDTYDRRFYVVPNLSRPAFNIVATIDEALVALGSNAGIISLAPGDHASPTTRLPSKVQIIGCGELITSITQADPDVIPLQSKWHSQTSGSPAGGVVLRDFKLVAHASSTTDGIVLLDWYSKIQRVEVRNFGARGIVITGKRSDASDIGFQLVENRYEDLTISGCHGVGFAVESGNRCTDGFLDRLIVAGVSSGAEPESLVKIETSAGWQIGKVHVYGNTTSYAMQVLNAWSTTLISAQIEKGWIGAGLYATVQQGLHIGALTVTGDADSGSSTGGGQFVKIAKTNSGTYPNDGVNIGTLTVIEEFAFTGTLYAVSWDYNAADVKIAGLQRQGAQYASIGTATGFGSDLIKFAENLKVTGKVRDSATSRTLAYEGIPLALATRNSWSGSAAQTITVTLPQLGDNTVMMCQLLIGSIQNNNGVLRAAYRATLIISSKNNASNNWTVKVVDASTPTGFSVNPTVACTHTNGTTTGELVVSFTATDSDGYGSVGLLIAHA